MSEKIEYTEKEKEMLRKNPKVGHVYKQPKQCSNCKGKHFRLTLCDSHVNLFLKQRLTYCCLKCGWYYILYPKVKPIRFNRRYSKLNPKNCTWFTTIRPLENDYILKQIYPLKVKRFWGYKRIGYAQLYDLQQVSPNFEFERDHLWMNDTDEPSLEDAITHIQKIYPNEKDHFQILFLKRMDKHGQEIKNKNEDRRLSL